MLGFIVFFFEFNFEKLLAVKIETWYAARGLGLSFGGVVAPLLALFSLQVAHRRRLTAEDQNQLQQGSLEVQLRSTEAQLEKQKQSENEQIFTRCVDWLTSNDDLNFGLAIVELEDLVKKFPEEYCTKVATVLAQYIRSRASWPIPALTSQRASRRQVRQIIDFLEQLIETAKEPFGIDLSKSDLSGLDLTRLPPYVQMAQSNLANSNFLFRASKHASINYHSYNFHGTRLMGDMSKSLLYDCNISGADFMSVTHIGFDSLMHANYEAAHPPLNIPDFASSFVQSNTFDSSKEIPVGLPLPLDTSTTPPTQFTLIDIEPLWNDGTFPKPLSRNGHSFLYERDMLEMFDELIFQQMEEDEYANLFGDIQEK